MTKHGNAARMNKNAADFGVRKINGTEEAAISSDVTKKRIVRMQSVPEREPAVGGSYGKHSEPASESCVKSAA